MNNPPSPPPFSPFSSLHLSPAPPGVPPASPLCLVGGVGDGAAPPPPAAGPFADWTAAVQPGVDGPAAAGGAPPPPAVSAIFEEMLELLDAGGGAPGSGSSATSATSAASASAASAVSAEDVSVEPLPSLPSTPLLVEALGGAAEAAGAPSCGGAAAAATRALPPCGAGTAKRGRTPPRSPPCGSSFEGGSPRGGAPSPWVPQIMLASAGISGSNMALRPSVPLIRPHPLRVRLESLLPEARAWLFPAPLFGDTPVGSTELPPFSSDAFHSAFFRERTTVAMVPPAVPAVAGGVAAAAAASGVAPLMCVASFVGVTHKELADGTILGSMVNEWTFRRSSQPFPGLPAFTARTTRVAAHSSWGLLLVTSFDEPDVLCLESLAAKEGGGVLREQCLLRREAGDTPALLSTHVVHLARATKPPPGAAASGASAATTAAAVVPPTSACEQLVDDLISGHYVGAVADGMAGLSLGVGPPKGCLNGPGEGRGGGHGRGLAVAPVPPHPLVRPKLASPVPFSFHFGHTGFATQLRLRSLAVQTVVVGVPAPRTPALCLPPPPEWVVPTGGGGQRGGTSTAAVLGACGWGACMSMLPEARVAASLVDGNCGVDRPFAAAAADAAGASAGDGGGASAPLPPPPTSLCKTCGAPTRPAVPPPKKRRRRHPSSPLDEAAWARVLRNRESARASNERRRLARAAARAADAAAAAEGAGRADGEGRGREVMQRSVT